VSVGRQVSITSTSRGESEMTDQLLGRPNRAGICVHNEQLPDRANAVSLAAKVREYSGSLATHKPLQGRSVRREALDEAKEVASGILPDQGPEPDPLTGVTAGQQLGTHQTGTELARFTSTTLVGATRSRTCTWWAGAAL
jgi:hypothetical protein